LRYRFSESHHAVPDGTEVAGVAHLRRRNRTPASACSHASIVVAFRLAGLALSFDNSAVAAAFVVADAFDMWPESNGGCGSYSIASWIAFARLSPPIWPASHSARSSPADTPALVTMSSSCTIRSSATAVTPNPFNSGMASQCDVARRPLSRPAAARITDPEHTDVVQLAVRWARRNHSSSASSRACTGVDGPPGTRITSGEGVSANEWVAPMTSTPESAVIGPDSCHTNLT